MTEPSDTQLLPCPFCGGKAEITAAEECGPQAYVVACTEPTCLSSSKVIFALKDDVTNQLVESWNKRTRSIQRSYDEATPVDLAHTTVAKEPPCPECGQPYIARGTPVYKAVERILDDHSAWIARPSAEVTRAVAFAATIAAHRIVDEDRASHEAPLLAALKTIVEAGDCTVESIREGRDAIARARPLQRPFNGR